MEKGSQGTALGLGSGGPKPTGEGRFLNVGRLYGTTSKIVFVNPPHGERELG